MSYTFGSAKSRQSSCENQNWAISIPSNSLFTPKSVGVQIVDEIYGHVEAHLKGVVKVLKPMLEINNIIAEQCRGCKSDDHFDRGKSTETTISYYTPQKSKCNNSKSSDQRQCCCKCVEKSTGKKLSSILCPNTTDKSTFKSSSEEICTTQLLQLESENKCSKASSSQLSTSIGNKSSRHHHSQKKSNTTHQSLESKNCSICKINIKKVKILAFVPCKHSFCYPCMSQIELNSCPKCSKPIKRETIKNITYK